MSSSHSLHASLLDLPLKTFLDRLGSSEPAPGGGAGSALAAATAAALVEMTANLTVGRPRYASVQDEAEAIVAEAHRLRQLLAQQVDEDARAYAALTAAYKLPKGSDHDLASRQTAIESALLVAAEVPLTIARACSEVLALCERAAPTVNASAVSDVVVAAHLAFGAQRGAVETVEINLALMKDATEVERLGASLAETLEGSERRVQAVQLAAHPRLPIKK